MNYEELHDDRQYSVWTQVTDNDWAASNAGVPDLLIVGGISLYKARYAVARLHRLNPNGGWFIRDGSNNVVPNDPTTHPDPAAGGLRRAPRRPLGKRD